MAITSDGAFGFVTAGQRGRVVMVDVGTREILAAIVVGGAPRAVVTEPYLPLIRAGAGGGGGPPPLLIGVLVAGLVALLAWIVLGVLWWRGVIGGRRRHSV